ncbi:MAG: hypothetical protein FWG73_06725 [Planctomycetaceae bacterium]|nr:hypothetical protein [Planctomycetaceae bacterium]
MDIPKNFKPSYYEDKSNIGVLLRFLVRHGEKFALGIAVLFGLYFAASIRNYQPLAWHPSEMEQRAEDAESTIVSNTHTTAEGQARFFDYATRAEHFKRDVSLEPYRHLSAWRPVLHPPPSLRGNFEILTAYGLHAEPARRAGAAALGVIPPIWHRPPMPGAPYPAENTAIWVNLYGTIPHWEQGEIFNQTFDEPANPNEPWYAYYELERAEILPNEDFDWQPVIVYPGVVPTAEDSDASLDRLISLAQRQAAIREPNMLLFSDFDVEPARTYAYRIRLYLANPNYNLQETFTEEGVDTQSEFIQSDWSDFARVYMPDRTFVQLRSVVPSDQANFPRQSAPLQPVRGTFILDYFDIELGQSLPTVERAGVLRGMLLNVSREEANRIINRGKAPEEVVSVNFPDTGLRSGVCVMDLSGGRPFQKRTTREAQSSPDLSVPAGALLLLPDGSMQVMR